MKKYILSGIFSVITVLSFAQTERHLSFKGVPLEGTLNEYVAKMKQNGFTLIKTEEESAFLHGDFAGYKSCIVGVSTLKQKDLVYKIAVIFPESDTWSSLSSNYFNLKDMLTEKYGDPAVEIEKFDTYSEPRDDRGRMHAVQFDNCKYQSIWSMEQGQIELSIDHQSVLSCYVRLLYFDKINGDKIKSSAIDDL